MKPDDQPGQSESRGSTRHGWVTKQIFDPTTPDGAAQLEAHVECRLGGRVRDFRLVVANKGLILQGRASTYYAKQLAQHAVMEATALPILANGIDVC